MNWSRSKNIKYNKAKLILINKYKMKDLIEKITTNFKPKFKVILILSNNNLNSLIMPMGGKWDQEA